MRYEGKVATMAFAVVLLGASSASALPWIGTGSGDPGDSEPRWVLQGGRAPLFIVNPASPVWVDPGEAGISGQWISPYMAETVGHPGFNCVEFCPASDLTATTSNATYTYTLQFDDPNSPLHITWASDNRAEFFLNGSPVGLPLEAEGFYSLSVFTILAEAFNDGINTNTFAVVVTNLAQNGGNPTGLLVNIHTPLPPALLLFGSGLAGLGWLSLGRGRRQRTRAG